MPVAVNDLAILLSIIDCSKDVLSVVPPDTSVSDFNFVVFAFRMSSTNSCFWLHEVKKETINAITIMYFAFDVSLKESNKVVMVLEFFSNVLVKSVVCFWFV